jgi:hypothetical protein
MVWMITDELTAGTVFYVLSAKWRNTWAKFVGVDPDAMDRAIPDEAPPARDRKRDGKGGIYEKKTTAIAVTPKGNNKETKSIANGKEVKEVKVHESASESDLAGLTGSSGASAAIRFLRPGPIDNSDIIDKDSKDLLRANLRRGVDYTIVSESLWTPLVNWYGGGPAIARHVIDAGIDASRTQVIELYPLHFKLFTNIPKREIPCIFSRLVCHIFSSTGPRQQFFSLCR